MSNNTKEIMKLVRQEVDSVEEKNLSVNEIVSQLKSTIITAMTKKGITVDDSIKVAAKMIVLASLV